jgi:glycosyltransferase A (GT-A) superfamily protein (DUF2064 family)
MKRPDKHGASELEANISSGGHSPAMLNIPAACGKARQAVLVFANPITIDCQRRKWPASFQQLFDTGRFAGLATAETDVHVFTSVEPFVTQSTSCTVHLQRYTGTSFGERLENAVEHLAGLGYGKIVIVGSDCPTLTADEILNAFRLLDQKQLVLGPDHRGGCYLIGLHSQDRARLAGIRWNRNIDCAELLLRYGKNRTAQLPVKIDLDTLEDLRLLAQSRNSWSTLAAALLQSLDLIHVESLGHAYRSATKHQTLSWQLPPPVLSTF